MCSEAPESMIQVSELKTKKQVPKYFKIVPATALALISGPVFFDADSGSYLYRLLRRLCFCTSPLEMKVSLKSQRQQPQTLFIVHVLDIIYYIRLEYVNDDFFKELRFSLLEVQLLMQLQGQEGYEFHYLVAF
uniref:Uncharacterized protein n=1 Tax=Solanum lycopersicum TaxID=4081 RepID=A0A3Q7IJI1_SOLLC